MASARTVDTIEAPAGEVWKYVENFADIAQFVPPIASSVGTGSGVGMQRVCTFQDGAQITETLLALDTQNRSLKYNVHDPNPLPFENYVSTTIVKELGPAKCEVDWSAEFEAKGMSAPEVTTMLEGIFQQGIDSLRALTVGTK